MRRRGILVALGLAAQLAAAGPAGAADLQRLEEIGKELITRSTLLGDPYGARSTLARSGLHLQLYYQQFFSWKPGGGGAVDAYRAGDSGSYDFFAHLDFEPLTGWQSLDFLLHVKGQYDNNINEEVGALSDPIDDADFHKGIYVSELWLQQGFLEDRVRARLGYMEQQTLWDRNEFANNEDIQFLNTALDNNLLVPLPPGLAAAAIVTPLPWLDIASGVADADNGPKDAGFDTMFDGVNSLNFYLELAVRAPLPGHLAGNYRLGMFVDGRKKKRWGSEREGRGHLGAYVSADQWVFRERGDKEQGLGLFGRLGLADRRVNKVAWFWSVGLHYVGAIPGRDRDVLGLGSYQAIGSGRFREEVDRNFRRETGIELYYRIQMLPWLAVTPDFQYIIDPGAAGTDDAMVATMRLRVSF